MCGNGNVDKKCNILWLQGCVNVRSCACVWGRGAGCVCEVHVWCVHVYVLLIISMHLVYVWRYCMIGK